MIWLSAGISTLVEDIDAHQIFKVVRIFLFRFKTIKRFFPLFLAAGSTELKRPNAKAPQFPGDKRGIVIRRGEDESSSSTQAQGVSPQDDGKMFYLLFPFKIAELFDFLPFSAIDTETGDAEVVEGSQKVFFKRLRKGDFRRNRIAKDSMDIPPVRSDGCGGHPQEKCWAKILKDSPVACRRSVMGLIDDDVVEPVGVERVQHLILCERLDRCKEIGGVQVPIRAGQEGTFHRLVEMLHETPHRFMGNLFAVDDEQKSLRFYLIHITCRQDCFSVPVAETRRALLIPSDRISLRRARASFCIELSSKPRLATEVS